MIKTTIQNRIFKITTNKKTYTVNVPNKVSLYAQSGGIDYANMTLDTSPTDADVVPVNGTRNSVLSQLKISLANIKSYVLGTLFNASSGHDHDGTDSKQIAYANVTGTPAVFPLINNAGAHNSIYRGISLGTSVSAAQFAAIDAGTFVDMFIGDYWTINSVVWRIAAFDYYYNVGDVNCTTHHVVVVPDTSLYNAQMNTTNTTENAYWGSAMYTTNLDAAKSTINSAFGASHVLNHRIQLANTLPSGQTAPTNWGWYDSTVELMTEMQVYGSRVWGAPANNGFGVSSQDGMFPLFAMRHDMVHNRGIYWMQDVVSATNFANVYYNGFAASFGASGSLGVRPAFCLKS